MMRTTRLFFTGLALVAGSAAVGCQKAESTTAAAADAGSPPTAATDDVAAERAKLTPADRALVEAQEWCVISTEERLGSMGPPIKLDFKGRPVFVCCKGCKKKAEANPDRTLATLDELKAKARAEKGVKE